jgi:hypothetical protein
MKNLREFLELGKNGVTYGSILGELQDKYVPVEGKAYNVYGEILRALGRISYRYLNDGDYFYEDYGVETCGSSAWYLKHVCPLKDKFAPSIKNAEFKREKDYEYCIADLYRDFLDSDCEHLKKEKNTVDSRYEFESNATAIWDSGLDDGDY